MSGRQQYVKFGGKTLHLYDCPSGVPQGSNLGPYLFLMFVADVHEYLGSSCCLLYADDLKLYRAINGDRDQMLLQQDLNELTEWSHRNKLTLSIEKCCKMTFTRAPQPIRTTYSKGGEILESHDKMRDLGVILQKDLSFMEQINSETKYGHCNEALQIIYWCGNN